MKLFSIIFTALLASGAIANEISDSTVHRMLKGAKNMAMGTGGAKMGKGGGMAMGTGGAKMGKGGGMAMGSGGAKSKKRSKKSTEAPIEQVAVLSLDVVFTTSVLNRNIRSAVISSLASSLAVTRRRYLAPSQADLAFLDSFFGEWTLDISRYDCSSATCAACLLKAANTEAYEDFMENETFDLFADLVPALQALGTLDTLTQLDNEDDVVDMFPPISDAPSASPIANTTRIRLLESRGDYLEWEDFEEDINF